MSNGNGSGVWRVQLGAVPRPALALGLAGILPFVAAVAALLAGPREAHALSYAALVGYGVAILSFMGGVQWGIAMRSSGDHKWLPYGASVAPALLGWIAFLSPTFYQLPVLAAGFAAMLAYDLEAVRRGSAPDWYRYLRWPLTIGVMFCIILAWLGTQPFPYAMS